MNDLVVADRLSPARKQLKGRLDRIDSETIAKGAKAVGDLWLLEQHGIWRKGREVLRAYPELEANKPRRGGRGVAEVSFATVATATGRADTTIARWTKLFLSHQDEKDFLAWAKAEVHDTVLPKWEASLIPALADLRMAKPPVPDGKYSTIVIDPPWDTEKIEREVRPRQYGFDYPTMSEEQLAEFGVPAMAADDCHLFCWATQKHLPAAFRLLDAWGFHYVLAMVWHKPGGPQPFGLPQYNCEFVLYARRGAPEFTDTKAFSTCFQAPRREHSRKPDEFYDTVLRVTDGPRIDVFSREKRDGFEQFGNELEKFAA